MKNGLLLISLFVLSRAFSQTATYTEDVKALCICFNTSLNELSPGLKSTLIAASKADTSVTNSFLNYVEKHPEQAEKDGEILTGSSEKLDACTDQFGAKYPDIELIEMLGAIEKCKECELFYAFYLMGTEDTGEIDDYLYDEEMIYEEKESEEK